MNVEKVTKILAVAMPIIAVLLILAMIVRSGKVKKQGGTRTKAQKVIAVLLCVLLVFGAVANVAVYMFNNIINQYFSSVKVDELAVGDATEASRQMSERLAEEGIVLLKNQDSVLPLGENAKVNVFGMASIRLVYGGSGSGASDESANVSLQQGLANAGISVNEELTQFYQGNKPDEKKTNIFNLKGGDYNIHEPAVSAYSQQLLDNAKAFSDTALVVFSRSGGEGGDLPMDMADYTGGDAGKHYLELQAVEREMLDMVKENFSNVIVIINSSNAMELGFLEEEGIQAAIWVGGPGSTGCNAIGSVLAGTVNPSGRLTDIYAYDLTTAPAYYNAGDYEYYINGERAKQNYVEYAEGIYVGYRYYETRYINNETFECDEDAYQATVQYPFGYGLSYTSFTQEITNHKENDGKIEVEVKITNTGSVAGKEVAQIYFTAPYTIGGVEKSHVVLAAFGKTELLEPGESETLELVFDVEDMASYDEYVNGCYVLDGGDYQIKLMNNSHDVIDSFVYTVKETVVYNEGNPRSSDNTAAVNLFDYAAGDVVYVSRADWEGTLPTERVESKETTQVVLDQMNKENAVSIYCQDNNEGASTITTGANNGLMLEDMVGLDYDDPQWDLLLDQLTMDEMTKLIGYGGFATASIDSIGKVTTIDIDGPAGLNALTSDISGVQFPSETLIASSFNTELAAEMGATYADEAIANGVTGLYAPAANIHRTPFSGRNFEYYSEDPVLSAKMGAAVVQGTNTRGVYTYIKHFALNDQETNRSGIAVWSNEQAIREIYLKAFEDIVKEGGTKAIMSSYNRIGTVWAGGCKELLTNVLREEWGFVGMVASDYDNGGYMNVDQAIRAGGDIMLSTLGHPPTEVSTQSATGQQAIRRAVKNVLYTVVNSRAYTDPITYTFPYWLVALIAVDAVIVLGGGVGGILTTRSKKKRTEEE